MQLDIVQLILTIILFGTLMVLHSTDSSSSAFIDGIFRTDTSAGSSHRGGIKL